MKQPVAPPLRKPVQEQARTATPIGGLNYSANFMDFPITDAYLLDNFIPRTNGLEIRKGWAHWITPKDTNPPWGEIRSLMGYNAAVPADSKLFMSDSTSGRVWDITYAETDPVVALSPTTNSLRAGEWYDTHYHNVSGTYLCIVSAGAGYFTYSTADGWVDRGALVTFPAGDTHTVEEICFVWSWKNRLWFLIKDSPVAYYLPIGAIQGALKSFDFGQQLARGGPLSFGTTWTYDAGSGIDDSLILVSQQGELLIYQGMDPANAATFQLKGLWYIGDIPVGRRGYCAHGGSLLILCTYGLVAMEDVIAGRITATDVASGVAAKVNQTLATRIADYQDQYYWSLTVYPKDAIIVLATPIYVDTLNTYQQMGMNSITNAWCTFTGMDILCAIVWQGQFIFGTRESGVKLGFHNFQDNTDIDNLDDGDDITARFQNVFNAYQSPNSNKRMLRIKLYGLVDRTALKFMARFKSEYVLSDDVYAPHLSQGPLPFWDIALWDEDSWAIGAGSFHTWFGVSGFGKKLSLQCAVRSGGKVLVTDYESLYETGIGL